MLRIMRRPVRWRANGNLPPSFFTGLLMSFARPSGRAPEQLRTVAIERGFTRHAEGSVLVRFGDTHASRAPPAWRTACPASCAAGRRLVTANTACCRAPPTRGDHEAAPRKQGGRTLEIQRLIWPLAARLRGPRRAGRTHHHPGLRRAAGRRRHPHRRDHGRLRRAGGRSAALAAGQAPDIAKDPIVGAVAAVSVGIFRGVPVLDLTIRGQRPATPT